MGSFWGLSDAGKEAQGFPRQWGAYTSAQAQNNWIPWSDNSYSAGNSASDWYKNYQLGRASNGIGSVDQMRGYGSQIMPGVDQYVSDKQGRIQQMIDSYNSQVPNAQQTMGQINQNLSDEGDMIRQNRDYALNDIGDTYGRGMTSENAAHDAADQGYTSALANTELLKPGSQFQQAETARSFAGENSATAGRMRAAGISSNSPQGIALMQRSQSAQGRAMDEKAAQGTQQYVGTKNNLLLGQGGEAIRHAGASEGLDQTRSTNAIGTQNHALDESTQWENARNNAALTGRNLSQQDWQTNSNLLGQQNDAQLEAIGLNRDMFNAGMGYNSADLNERNQGAEGVGNYGNQQLNYAVQAGNLARGYGNDAMNAYKTAYGYEAPNAGWGAKILAGLGGAGLNAIFPGAGSMLSGAYSSFAPQQAPGGYGGGGYGGYGGGYGGGGGGGYGSVGGLDLSSLAKMFKGGSGGYGGGDGYV